MRLSSQEQPSGAQYWSIAQLARALRVSYSTVMRLVRRGYIRAIRIGRLWRISDEEVQRLRREGTVR